MARALVLAQLHLNVQTGVPGGVAGGVGALANDLRTWPPAVIQSPAHIDMRCMQPTKKLFWLLTSSEEGWTAAWVNAVLLARAKSCQYAMQTFKGVPMQRLWLQLCHCQHIELESPTATSVTWGNSFTLYLKGHLSTVSGQLLRRTADLDIIWG